MNMRLGQIAAKLPLASPQIKTDMRVTRLTVPLAEGCRPDLAAGESAADLAHDCLKISRSCNPSASGVPCSLPSPLPLLQLPPRLPSEPVALQVIPLGQSLAALYLPRHYLHLALHQSQTVQCLQCALGALRSDGSLMGRWMTGRKLLM